MRYTTGTHKVLVAGGRRYQNRAKVRRVLDEIHSERPITTIIVGNGNIAKFALGWARGNGVSFHQYHAEWKKYGKRAGFRRSAQMMQSKPDLVVAFSGRTGTDFEVKEALKLGLKVRDERDGEPG